MPARLVPALLALAVVVGLGAGRGPARAAEPAAAVDPSRAPSGALSCSGCHSERVADSIVPTIYGRPADEVVAAMAAFRSGERDASVMGRIARGFTEDETQAIALWLTSRRRP